MSNDLSPEELFHDRLCNVNDSLDPSNCSCALAERKIIQSQSRRIAELEHENLQHRSGLVREQVNSLRSVPPEEIQADTGHAEADRIINRLSSSDPDFDDCVDACVLIRKLVVEHKGPDGFDTWKDAAIAERLKQRAAPPNDAWRALLVEKQIGYCDSPLPGQPYPDYACGKCWTCRARAALASPAAAPPNSDDAETFRVWRRFGLTDAWLARCLRGQAKVNAASPSTEPAAAPPVQWHPEYQQALYGVVTRIVDEFCTKAIYGIKLSGNDERVLREYLSNARQHLTGQLPVETDGIQS